MHPASKAPMDSGTDRVAKRLRVDGPTDKSSLSVMPSSVISILTNEAGERAGAPVDLPVSTTSKQLQLLINTLLSNDDKVSFSSCALKRNHTH